MPFANWKSRACNVVQSLLFNNPHRVIDYRVRDEQGRWRSRSEMPAPVRRLFETEASPARTCLQTIQFVHHMLIPPGGRHVAELHIHPDAEELAVIMSWFSRKWRKAALSKVVVPPFGRGFSQAWGLSIRWYHGPVQELAILVLRVRSSSIRSARISFLR